MGGGFCGIFSVIARPEVVFCFTIWVLSALSVRYACSGNPTPMPGRAIIFFDGVCNLCNAAVQFILVRDPTGEFQFASLQSDAARRIMGTQTAAESIVLVEPAKVYTKSS